RVSLSTRNRHKSTGRPVDAGWARSMVPGDRFGSQLKVPEPVTIPCSRMVQVPPAANIHRWNSDPDGLPPTVTLSGTHSAISVGSGPGLSLRAGAPNVTVNATRSWDTTSSGQSLALTRFRVSNPTPDPIGDSNFVGRVPV